MLVSASSSTSFVFLFMNVWSLLHRPKNRTLIWLSAHQQDQYKQFQKLVLLLPQTYKDMQIEFVTSESSREKKMQQKLSFTHKHLHMDLTWGYMPLRSPLLFLILWIDKGTGFFKTVTLILFQTSGVVGSWAIFSTISMSSGRTEPNTVYAFFHSWWFARLMKNSGPEPIQATEPLLIIGHTSVGILLNVIPWGSSFPWINAKGGPKGAWESHKTRLSYNY